MSEPERLDVLILGSGQGGKLLAWYMARSGQRVTRQPGRPSPPAELLAFPSGRVRKARRGALN